MRDAMRLFLAINLSGPVKAALIDAQNEMYDGGVRGSFTPEENLHLTLAFIGEYPDPEPVLEALGELSFSPFELSPEGIGCFGDLWWAGMRASPQPAALARRIRHALAEKDIPAVGGKPDKTYKAGSWDAEPGTKTASALPLKAVRSFFCMRL